MSALTTTQPKAPPSRRFSYATALKEIRAERQPLIDYDRLYAQEHRYGGYFRPSRPMPSVERVLGPHGEDDHRLMQELDAFLRPVKLLQPIREGLAAIVDMRPDVTRARLVIGLMVDGFPNARPHSPEGYIERMTDEVMGEEITTPVLAHACAKMIKTSTFPPAVSELLKACEEIGSLPRLLARIDSFIEQRSAVDALCAAAQRRRAELVPDGDQRWPWEILRDERFAALYQGAKR